MSKLEKYSSYKDSGVEWLGEIPSEWEVKKLKYLGKMFAGLTDKKGDDFSKEKSIDKQAFIPFTNICNNLKIDKNQMQYVRIKLYEKQNKVKLNDIIFLMSSETLEDIGKCSIHLEDEKFYLNSFCKGYRIENSKINAEFLNYLLLSTKYRNYFALVGRGFTRINIKQEYITNLFALLPRKQEQIKIASFLDTKTEQLDKAIKQKEQLIELLKERRQILINDAVTKGIDETVAMKDSGVEWIGSIPEHWVVKKNKYIFFEVNERSKDGEEELLSVSHTTGVTPRSEKNVNMFMSEDYTGSKTCSKGDLVINIMWAWMGAMGIADRTGIVSSSYGIYRQIKKHTINIVYLEYLLKTNKYIEEYNKRSTGLHASRLRLYSDMFFDMKIGFAPQEEQKRIIDFIEEKTLKIDKAINLQQQQITKLKEYKTTLIDSVVIGKVRVK